MKNFCSQILSRNPESGSGFWWQELHKQAISSGSGRKAQPDLVITDIRMPVMDGITLLTKVREQFPFTKFIITSGFSDFEYAKKAITLKVSDYLLKPVDSEELKEALSKIKQEFQIAGNDYEEGV